MNKRFDDAVDIVEEKREEFHKNYLKSKKEIKEGKLHFTRNIDDLKNSLQSL